MPFIFSFEEYADKIYVYGFCDGYSVLALAEYQQLFPNRRIPNRRVFTGVYRALRDTGRLPGVRIAAERGVNEGVNEEGIVRMVHRSPRTSTQELQDVFVFPTRECGEHCMQRACIHTMCSECNISDLAILLRGWTFASGSMAVASCIVTSCLQMKRNLIATVSIIHTILILHVELQISWTTVSPGDGSDVAVPTIGQPSLQT